MWQYMCLNNLWTHTFTYIWQTFKLLWLIRTFDNALFNLNFRKECQVLIVRNTASKIWVRHHASVPETLLDPRLQHFMHRSFCILGRHPIASRLSAASRPTAQNNTIHHYLKEKWTEWVGVEGKRIMLEQTIHLTDNSYLMIKNDRWLQKKKNTLLWAVL